MPWRGFLLLALVLAGACQPDADPSAAPGAADHDPSSGQAAPETPSQMRAVVVDDPPLARVLARQVAPLVPYQLQVIERTSDELEGEWEAAAEADVLIVPAQWLGTLAERRTIAVVPKSVVQRAALQWNDVLPIDRQQEVRWGENLFALPLGSAHFQLLYRPDVLEQAGLAVPQTWGELAAAVQAIQAVQEGESVEHDEQDEQREAGEAGEPEDSGRPAEASEVQVALAEPLAPGWAAKALLARAAPYARERSRYSTLFDYQTMEPLISTPPFVRALEELVDAHRGHAAEAMGWTPEGCRQLVQSGRCALALTWPAADRQPDSAGQVAVGVAPLPGADQVYAQRTGDWAERGDGQRRVPLLGVAGRLICVGRSAPTPAASWDLAVTLCGPKLSGDISPHSAATAPARRSHLDRVVAWLPAASRGPLGQQYVQVIEGLEQQESFLHALRVPGFLQYEKALDRAVHQALQGAQSPKEALEQAAERWWEITRSLGVDQQIEAYRSSLGLDLG